MKIAAFFHSCMVLFFALVITGNLHAGPIRTIVLDAGHGGHDPGAIGVSKSNEKDVVLDVVLRIGKLIEANYPEVKVLYTRKTDVFVELGKRADIANKNKADLFISIHCNSAPSATAYGAETFVMGLDKTNANMALVQKENAVILKESNYEDNYGGFDPYSPESYIIFSLRQNAFLTQSTNFANHVQKNFTQDLKRYDRGVKQAPFLVLWRTTMPSVLIELGFLSNKEEEAYLISDKGKKELSQAIFKAIAQSMEEQGEHKTYFVTETETVPESRPDSSIIPGTVAPKPDVPQPEIDRKVEEKQPVETRPVHVNAEEAKPVVVPLPEKETAPAPKKETGVVYKVQFATIREQKSMDDYAFKNLPDVQCHPVGNFFTYTAGEVHTYTEALEVLQKVKDKGYKDAYIIALQNGQRIPLDKARSLTE